MQELIEEAIFHKAKSVLRGQSIEFKSKLKYADKYYKRTGSVAALPSNDDPSWWQYHPHFDPKYCISHTKFLSRVIWNRLQEGNYQPVPAIQFDVPKPDGSHREIMAFAIPDAAVANVVHRKATNRNINLFSSYSFAYRPDKEIFDAILHIIRSLLGPNHTYFNMIILSILTL